MTGNSLPAACKRCGRVRQTNHSRPGLYCMACMHTPKHTSDDWMAAGKCRDKQHDADWWWPDSGGATCIRVAQNICVTCPVRQRCLDYAIEHNEREGIWGGLLPAARLRVAVLEREA